MRQSIVDQLFPRRRDFLLAPLLVSRKNSLNYAMFNMRNLTGRQQQSNINSDESESEKKEFKEGNEQLTAAEWIASLRRRVSIYYSIFTKRNERRSNCTRICFLFLLYFCKWNIINKSACLNLARKNIFVYWVVAATLSVPAQRREGRNV